MIAHYIMHGGYRDVNIKSQYFIPSSFEERQANMLAGMILMPYAKIIEIYKQNESYIDQNKYDIVGRLQEEFYMSRPAVSVMLSILGLTHYAWN